MEENQVFALARTLQNTTSAQREIASFLDTMRQKNRHRVSTENPHCRHITTTGSRFPTAQRSHIIARVECICRYRYTKKIA